MYLSVSRRNLRSVTSDDWKVSCSELLDAIWKSEDAAPFREPVDNIEHPDYYQVIDTPMDLRSIKEDLLGDNYETPNDFAHDMRLVFTNSRNYNTNKKSRVNIFIEYKKHVFITLIFLNVIYCVAYFIYHCHCVISLLTLHKTFPEHFGFYYVCM